MSAPTPVFVDVVNPLLPAFTGWHVLILGLVLLLPLAALITLALSRNRMSTTHVLIWVAVIVLAPVLGSLVWFAFGIWFHRSRAEPVTGASAPVPPR